MKTKVLDFLKEPGKNVSERFNKAMALGTESGLPAQILARYNRKGATAENVDNMIYDLQKHLQISKVDIAKHTVAEVQVDAVPDVPVGRTAADLSEIQLDAFHQVLRDMNAEQKQGFRFREQYPFLQEKDVPNEFKVLTADALSSYDGYKKKHEELFAALHDVAEPRLTNAEVYDVAFSLLEDFEQNREIHAELEHYQKNRKILGEHEIFADLKMQRDVAAIAPEKLGQSRNNISSQITKKNKAIKAEKDHKKTLLLKGELKALEAKKALIEKRIKGADAEK